MKKFVSLAAFAVVSFYSLVASAQTATLVTFSGPTGTGLDSDLLSGVLYLPAGYNTGSNYPAVVMLHGCSGMWSNRTPGATNGNGTPNLQNHIEKWGLQLASQGIIALAVDSYTRRKPSGPTDQDWQNQCSGATYGGYVDPYTTRVLDARAAWTYLDGDTKIDSSRIALLGWSQGAEAAMVESAETFRTSNTARTGTDATLFTTTVLYYPGCGSNLGFGSPSSSYWRPHHDLRLNLAELDGLRANCELRGGTAVSTYGSTSGSGHEVVRVTYAGADHGFDGVSQTWPAATCAAGGVGDTCAMNAADIDSLAFFLSRL